uniref:ABC transporter permease n=1 Tax=Anaerosphaera aminiphila TaxID=1120994 RepID=UPI000AE6FD1D
MNYMMKSEGSFYRVLIAPVGRSSIVLGQILEAVICTFLEVGIMSIVSSLLFSVKVATGLIGILLITLLVFLTSFFMADLSYVISLILPNEVVYETVMNAIVLPIFFLSSALFPIDGIKGVLAIAIKINPYYPCN